MTKARKIHLVFPKGIYTTTACGKSATRQYFFGYPSLEESLKAQDNINCVHCIRWMEKADKASK